ncbi:CSC1-like protein RXW8 isoform X2 [Cajanus cajan]|uniref:CSC1-like protein RXW8 isoform X2 n=1 Tax=Cajanus cajan TaxID=3821 RepID=UPI0010FBB692|nr:CSC1-like protein RXW8 isoform X2 [Cajanus cajan]
MDIAALLTSTGINIVICVVLFSFYSILRKQPINVNVYFGRRLASQHSKRINLCLERFLPSPSWIWKAWETSEDEIMAIGGLDGVVFVRILVFSIRVFSIAAGICIILVLPINYHGQDRIHKIIPFESLEVFTIENVKEGSKWLWAHCLALYVITLSACTLLYFEYKSITYLRLLHIIGSPPNPSHFTILVRSIPWSSEQSYCETVKNFFSHYHAPTYLSHQMIYKSGTVQKLKDDAEHMCKVIKHASVEKTCKSNFTPCCYPGFATNSFKKISSEMDSIQRKMSYNNMHLDTGEKDCAAAFVFFKSRYAALMAALVQQTSNPMLWVTDVAPEPHDVYWSNIRIPYRQLWLLPPMMMFFSAVEGSISRSSRKKSACCKVLYFTIWNVFFVNVFTGSVISQLSVFSSVTDLPSQLAKAVPAQSTFFTTYVLSSGWASLACEVMQFFPLLCNIVERFILRHKEDTLNGNLSFPYHTEVPKVLLFGFLGFTCSILAPLILPFLLIYFFLAYLVYRNQIINVYITKYDSGGQFWPIAHNTTIFSLIFAQLIALGVFGLKSSSIASGFTIPLLIGTLLFHQYCRKRFLPVFKSNSAQILIDLDLRDERCGRMEEIYEQLRTTYNQPNVMLHASCHPQCCGHHENKDSGESSEDMEKGKENNQKNRPQAVQRSLSLSSDKSVLGVN